VDITSKPNDITMASILTAAWSLLLSRLLSTRDVTFGGVATGRSLDLPDVETIVGPCYQYVPIRVAFGTDWTARSLLQHVQEQYVGNLPFESLGLKEIIENCTDWPSGTDFDSLVHHQDIDFFDEMPFGDTTCGVDLSNPHGEGALDQWKIISFPKGGQMFLGIESSESLQDFANSRLHELADVVELLIGQPDRKLFEA
jgi:hypothetical protein